MASSTTAWCFLPFVAMLCSVSHGFVPSDRALCPHSCTCSGDNGSMMDCLMIDGKGWTQTCDEFNKFGASSGVKLNLNLQRVREAFFPPLTCLPPLNSLRISQMFLTKIDADVFRAVVITSELDLSLNDIVPVSDKSFSDLTTLHTLNLSNNMISSTTNETFIGLRSLKRLDLSHNSLVTVQVSFLTELKNLEYLNLAYNKLAIFSSWHLPQPLTIKELLLQGNDLKWIDVDRTNFSGSPLKSLSTLDISLNPIDCSCTLDFLIKSLGDIKTLENPDESVCTSPEDLRARPILSLGESDLTCLNPRNIISFPSRQKSVRFKESITLECQSDGKPSPAIVWITPWGEMFAYSPKLLPSHSGFLVDRVRTSKQYEERNVNVITTISVNDKNDLVISEFRGSISGNFTCVAFNVVGNTSEHINLSIASVIKSVYMTSLFIGGNCASGFLIFGFLVGFVKMLFVRLSHKICFTVPIFSSAPSVKPGTEILSNPDSGGRDDDHLNFSDSSSCSIECGTDSDVLSKESDYNMTGSPAEKRPPLQLIESLEEARDRLRFGVGRKVESMKRNVQSIRHSSSAYVHTIMESGSTAASRVKASVAVGVETVKSHVQSFKELCGTGDMGSHTISMISVETDIDTNQQTSIVRQITYV